MLRTALRGCVRRRVPLLQRRSLSVPSDFNLLDDEAGSVRIDGYDARGFLVGDVQHSGSILAYQDLVLSWRVASFEEVTPDSLAPLLLFKVRPELLVLGCGDRIRRPSAQLTQLLRDHGVSLECIDTPNAAATFNVLAQEGRRVAGAFIPPAYVAPEPPSGAPRGRSLPKSSTTGPFPNWRDREATV